MDVGALLGPSRQDVAFPAVFQLVKAVVRANAVSDDTRALLKGWLKSNDTLQALLSLTVRREEGRAGAQLHPPCSCQAAPACASSPTAHTIHHAPMRCHACSAVPT
eukprot:366388-Chlamydomonas_euryale.AAC.5